MHIRPLRTVIDFRKVLHDGSLLTDPKNHTLLDSIKRFLGLQTHPALTGSITVSPKTARMRVAIALHTLDYFLLQGTSIGIAANGFRLVTADDVMMFVDTLTSHRTIKASIYEPNKRIASFLAEVVVSPKTWLWQEPTTRTFSNRATPRQPGYSPPTNLSKQEHG